MPHRTKRHLTVLVAGIAIAYIGTLPNPFHLDDFYRIPGNPGVERFWPPWRHFVDPTTMAVVATVRNYRPLLPLSLSINYALAGGKHSNASYHLGNIAFQAIAAVVLYFLILELLQRYSPWCSEEPWRSRLALSVALVFGVHPVSGIVVNYICARDLSMMMMFMLGSFLGYVRWRADWIRRRWVWILLNFALALLSKTSAAVMPALIIAFEVVLGGERLFRLRPWLRALPFALVVVAYFSFVRFVLNFSDIATLPERDLQSTVIYALTQAKLHVFQYGANFLWPIPIRQAPNADMATGWGDVRALIGLAAIAGTFVLAWRVYRACPLISFCILAYWILISPESSIIKMHNVSTHYRPYPGSPFLYLALGLAICHYLAPRFHKPVFFAILAYLVGCTVYHNEIWRTEERLWGHSVKYGTEALGHLNYALSVKDLQLRKHHLEEALRISPNYALAYINLGLTLMDLGQKEAGVAKAEEALRIAPNWPQGHHWVSVAYSRVGRLKDAARESATAARLEPKNLQFLHKAASDAQLLGDYRTSLGYLDRIMALNPYYKDSLLLRGWALIKLGDVQGGIRDYLKRLEREPNDAKTWNYLGYAYRQLKQYAEAVRAWEKAYQLDPKTYAEAPRLIAECYEALGDTASAARYRALYKPSTGKERTK